MKKEEIMLEKAKTRLDLNKIYLTISFTLFTFIVALNPDLLRGTFFLPVQLTLAIPLFLSSIFARSKLVYAVKKEMWEKYGFMTFLIGYSFLINVIGTLLSLFINLKIGMLFFAINILASITYSTLEVKENKLSLKSRITKDSFFILLLIFGGILPSLGVY